MSAINVTIRAVGNSKGVVLPKPVLAQAGLEGATMVEMSVENGAIVLRRPCDAVRAGWGEAARALAAQGGDEILSGDFANEGDAELVW